MNEVVWKTLIPRANIGARIDDMAVALQKYIDSSDVPAKLVFVAKGGLWFGFQLMEQLKPLTYEYGFISTKTYFGDQTGGEVALEYDGIGDIEEHRIVIIDDIADRRQTLHFLKGYMEMHGTAEVKTCVLLNKPSRKECEVALDFCGFNIPNTYVVGCGMDAGVEGTEVLRTFRGIMYREGTLPEGESFTTLTTMCVE